MNGNGNGGVVEAEFHPAPPADPDTGEVTATWAVFGEPQDTQLRTIGMEEKEANDWQSAGIDAKRMKLALAGCKDDLETLQETLREAVK